MLRAPVAAPSTAAAPTLSSCLPHCLLPVLSSDPFCLKLCSCFPFSLSCFWLLLLFLSGLCFAFFVGVSSNGFPAVFCAVSSDVSSAVSCLFYCVLLCSLRSCLLPPLRCSLLPPLVSPLLTSPQFLFSSISLSLFVCFSQSLLLLLSPHLFLSLSLLCSFFSSTIPVIFTNLFTTPSAIFYFQETVSLHLLSPILSSFLLYLFTVFTFLLIPVHCPVNSYISISFPTSSVPLLTAF